MSQSQRERDSLDRYITGNYGEDQFPAEVWCPECAKPATVHVSTAYGGDDVDLGWFCPDHAAKYAGRIATYVHFVDHLGDCAEAPMGTDGEGYPCRVCEERLSDRAWLLMSCPTCGGTNQEHRPGCAASADDFGEYDGGAPEPTARPDWPVDHEEGE